MATWIKKKYIYIFFLSQNTNSAQKFFAKGQVVSKTNIGTTP